MRGNGKDQLDLAYVGGKANAATHKVKDNGVGAGDQAQGGARMPLFDHFVGEAEDRLGDRQAERLGGLEIDDQLEFC